MEETLTGFIRLIFNSGGACLWSARVYPYPMSADIFLDGFSSSRVRSSPADVRDPMYVFRDSRPVLKG